MSRKVRDHKGSKFHITVTGRHVDVTEGMNDHVIDRIERLKHYFSRIIEVLVVMDIEKKHKHKVEILVMANHVQFQATETTDDMYVSIDRAADKIQRQLLKYKNKLKEHRPRKAVAIELAHNVLSYDVHDEESTDAPKIVSTDHFSAKPKFVDEAMIELSESDKEFLVFNEAETDKVNVIYKREDGNFGIIVP